MCLGTDIIPTCNVAGSSYVYSKEKELNTAVQG